MSKKSTSRYASKTPGLLESIDSSEPTAKTFSYPWTANASGPEAAIYQDQHGLPVLYSKTTRQNRESTNEAIRVLWHDLLSPITLIQGYCSTLLQCSDAITEEQRKSYLEGTISAGERLVRRLEKFRYVFDLEGSCRISAQRVAVRDLVRQVCSEIQNRTVDHTVVLKRPGELPKITVDPDKIREVVEILIVNAIAYSPEGSDITVELDPIRDREEVRNRFPDAPAIPLPSVLISVRDNSSAIPPTERELIFDKFYRRDHADGHNVQGAGLDLFIARIIVEAHRGRIWVTDCQGGGNIFRFSLPSE